MAETEFYPKTVTNIVQCPACGRSFDYTYYSEIHIPGDRKQKKNVLNRTMYHPKCPYCGQEFKIKPLCIYLNEIKKEFFIAIDSPDKTLENIMESGDIQIQDVHTTEDLMAFAKGFFIRRVVYDVDAFREKILLSDNNYDDRIVELMKLSLSGLLEKEKQVPVYRIFLEDTAGNQLVFNAFMGVHPPFELIDIKTPVSVYYEFRNRYLSKLGNMEDDEYINTDQKWAARSGLLKDDDPGTIIPM